MINLNDYLGKPFGELQAVLLRCGYHITGRMVDRKHKMTGVTFVRTSKGSAPKAEGSHSKVSIWHCWEEPDAFGISRAGNVTDIDFKNLDEKDEDIDGNGKEDIRESSGVDGAD